MSNTGAHGISADVAETQYGLFSEHEKMPNGELRFRLMSKDGSGYIRTVASKDSGWQISHFHKKVRETYIVQSGWMALVSLRGDDLVFQKLAKDAVATTEPLVPHNVYLPASAVIHTVKHGETGETDWEQFEKLDALTCHLNEDQILSRLSTENSASAVDERYSSYIALYNNLDNLIWKVPGFFAALLGIFLALIANIFSRADASMPSGLWALTFIFVATLLALGSYSMFRIRRHHSIVGAELQRLEPDGYFHRRERTLGTFVRPAAPHAFVLFSIFLSLSFFWASYAAFTENQIIRDALGSKMTVTQPIPTNDASVQ